METEGRTKRVVIMPVYNEESTAGDMIRSLSSLCHRLIVVDDGSTDGTGAILEKLAGEDPGVLLVSSRVNQGKSAALKTAFLKIIEMQSSGELSPEDQLITTDGDGQLPVEALKGACRQVSDQGLDLLIGCRDLSIYPFMKKAGNYFLSRLASMLTGFKFCDTQCGFRVMTVGAMKKILPHYRARGYACEQEISIIGAMLGMKIDNSFEINPCYYRSNSTYPDAVYITLDSVATYLRVKFNPGIQVAITPASPGLGSARAVEGEKV